MTNLPKRLTITLASAAIAVAFTVLTTTAIRVGADTQAEAATRKPMPVVVANYRQQPAYAQELQFLGLVQAANRGQVGFEIPGTVADILVYEGQRVDEGQILATLDTQTLRASQRAAASTLEQIAAELELARARTKRQAPLSDSGAISAQTFDDTRLAEKALESRYAAAEAQLEMLTIELEKSNLRAPYAGIVGRQLIDKGSVTQPGSPVFTLISSAEREAHIGISVEQISALEVGAAYAITVRDQTVDATLRAIRPDIDPISMTAAAIFELPADLAAYDGEPVSVTISKSVEQMGGWLPLSALLEGERGIWTVLVLRDQDAGTAAVREAVEVMHTTNGHAFVKGTVNNGDSVIADGVHRIAPGTRVEASTTLAMSGIALP
ncbi:MAG: efflux RND transporter periplasmic adaptor subunit [Congregibacter sp.]